MTIAELKNGISEMKYSDPKELEEKFYNTAIDFCIQMIELYEKYKEEEYPLGRNDYQE